MVVVGLRAHGEGGLSQLGAQEDGEEIGYLQGVERQGGGVRSSGTSGPPARLSAQCQGSVVRPRMGWLGKGEKEWMARPRLPW